MYHTVCSYNMHPIGISIDVDKFECTIKPLSNFTSLNTGKEYELQALPICLWEVYCIIIAINSYLCFLQNHRNVLLLFIVLFVGTSNIKSMVNKCRRPSWIHGKLVYFHQLDFRGFFLCFSYVYSELFGALFFGHSVDLNRFDKYFFLLKKNQFWLLKIYPPIIFL